MLTLIPLTGCDLHVPLETCESTKCVSALQDDLPADVRELALFSDGPGCGKEVEDHGWANLWRHQGLKF